MEQQTEVREDTFSVWDDQLHMNVKVGGVALRSFTSIPPRG